LFLEIILLKAGDCADTRVFGDGQNIDQRFVIEDDAGGVETGLARQTFDFGGQGNDFEIIGIAIDEGFELRVFAIIVPQGKLIIDDGVEDDFDLAGLIAINPGDIAQTFFGADRLSRQDVADPLRPVFLLQIGDDLVAVHIGEINVDIRHRLTFWIEEAFKKE